MLLVAFTTTAIIVSCDKDDGSSTQGQNDPYDPYDPDPYDPDPTPGYLAAPTGITAQNVGTTTSPSIQISWNAVSGATAYEVYYSRTNGNYISGGQVTGLSAIDNYPYDGDNYYKVKAVSSTGETSDFSNYAYIYVGSSNPNPDPDPTPSPSAPSAPTGLSIQNYGSNNIPDLRLSWNASQGATSYEIYHSTSSSYGYTMVNEVTNTTAAVPQPSNGNNYYKVKAKNSAGTSAFSNYVSYNYTASYSPCRPNITARASGSTIYLNWSFPTTSGCGRPNSIRVRVLATGSTWTDLDNLSGTATSYNFTYTGWINDGYVRVGIIGENDEGSASAGKIYNINTGQWYDF